MEKLFIVVKKLFNEKIVLSRIASVFFTRGIVAKHIQFYETLSNFQGSKFQTSKIKRDIIFSYLAFGFTAEEYFRYELYNLSNFGRKQFVSDSESDRLFWDLETPENRNIFLDKYETYKVYKEFYKRKVIKVDPVRDEDLFLDFCKNHKEFVIKPYNQCQGRGVHKVSVNSELDIQTEFESIKKIGTVVIEEPIIQTGKMKDFHPQSVNTVRIITFMSKSGCEIIASSVRLGIGDSFVDNGCLSSAVDREKGIIINVGRLAHKKEDYAQQYYAVHPDTGVQIIGAKIPYWDELKKMVVSLHEITPTVNVIGWDLCYSEKGWVVVEANIQPAIQTLSGTGIGARSVINHIKGELRQ